MTLKEYVSAVEQGQRSRVDLKNKLFYLNRKQVDVYDDSSIDEPIQEIEKLYSSYKRSYPSERSSFHMHDYFYALKADELSDTDLVNGEERTVARARLEASLLCWILDGRLTWDNDNQWFWQSKKEPDLIILKEWVA